MDCYTSLAGGYDSLTEDVQYEKRAAFLQKLLAKSTIPVHTVLDLACGTGTMTWLLAEAGYEMIGVDLSEELDLYGTVEAAVCCLDSINYLTDARALKRALQRLHLFVAPGGVFLFDVNTPCKLRSLDGQVFLDEREDLYCVWRADFDRRSRICTYGMDIFERQGTLWRRSLEEHREKAWEVEELKRFLTEAGFGRIRVWGDCRLRAPRQDEQRIYFSCIRE